MHIVHLSNKIIVELHREGMRYQLDQMGRATLAFTWLFRSMYRCLDCGGSEAYESKRRTFVEKYILPLFLLRQVRCANCFRKVTVSKFIIVGGPRR
jgi:hypothetical protein